jgi:hypothetical protein
MLGFEPAGMECRLEEETVKYLHWQAFAVDKVGFPTQ